MHRITVRRTPSANRRALPRRSAGLPAHWAERSRPVPRIPSARSGRAWAPRLLAAAACACLGAAAVPEPVPAPGPQPLPGPQLAVERVTVEHVPATAAPPMPACVPPAYGPEPYAGMTADPTLAALGAASCATVSCHGGPRAGNRAVHSFSATIWSDDDPHARAYEVLHLPRSQRMARLLGIGPAHEARQCLACHSVQDRAAATMPPDVRLPKDVLADGVGCSACHGDATRWQQVHVLPVWKTLSPEARESLGFTDLGTPAARAQTCVRCHVGDATHDVNHDLIAAGHPRLFFELAAYQRLWPRHWSPRGKAESADDFTARSWAVGQAVALEAVANQLVHRAAQAEAAVAAAQPHRWPEFSEFDCYSCHRSLGPTTGAMREPPLDRPRLGRPSWQPWYAAAAGLQRATLDGPPGRDRPGTAVERSALDLRRLLSDDWAQADRERLRRVRMEAEGLAVAARRRAAEIDARERVVLDGSHATLDALVGAAAADRQPAHGQRADGRAADWHPADWQTWDAAVQVYLAMEAARYGGPAAIGVWQPSGMRAGGLTSLPAPRRQLDDLRESLRFPPAADSPGPFDPRSFTRSRREVP